MRLEKLLRAILFGRFEPIETILAAESFVSGIFLLLPANESFLVLAAFAPFKTLLAVVLILVALIELAGLAMRGRHKPYALRKIGTMGIFISNLFISLSLVFLQGLVFKVGWLAFLALALIAAIVYLNIIWRDIVWRGL